jgi:hypothetical protein
VKKVIKIDDFESLPSSIYNFEVDVRKSIVKYKVYYNDNNESVISIYSLDYIDKAFKVTYFREVSKKKIVLDQ